MQESPFHNFRSSMTYGEKLQLVAENGGVHLILGNLYPAFTLC